jgi:DNA-directed RNA polymerase specialized sigma24 family protein
MGFNYSRERRKFEAEWVKLRAEYREAGFPEDKIDAMYIFDEEAFRSQRRYQSHNQSLPFEDLGGDDREYRTSLFAKFEQLSVAFDESDFPGRYAWVDTIENETLVSRLKQLKQSDLELLTIIAIEGYSQAEVARLSGCSKNAISKKIIRIRNFLR